MSIVKWEKLKDLPIPLYIRVEDILRILNIPNIDNLHYDTCYMGKYVEEEYLLKDHVEESRDHIYVVGVNALECECIEEGFIHDFLKGVRLVQYKTGAKIEGLTPSQASNYSPSDSCDNDSKGELRKDFASEDDDVEIV
ncbi:hypothetical protein IEQ34_011090 [Dendrobium chrysotoxum]|uniref:Uncharacterized protein n=1 Tax=Dendrobium chrysotoxum TaxID=161865 RepID=A0AAV7GY15_DENCH|nr:hypothetical protein IEQ34_011090 [Dendrobium chrysotoxum]